METQKFKRVNISCRLAADLEQQLRKFAKENDRMVTDVIESAVIEYINPSVPDTDPVQQKECIVIGDMKLETIAALLECSEKLQLTYPATIDLLFERVMEQAGRVDAVYIAKAKDKFNLK